MLLTIPADHESVLTLRDALDEDNYMPDVETAMIGGCAETGLEKDAYEVLAMAPQFQREVLLLRRNADGVLGILSTPSDENDADMDPSQRATYDHVDAGKRTEIPQQLANWMPESSIEDVGDVITRLIEDATPVDEPRADLLGSSARLLAPGLETLRIASEDLRDDTVSKVVAESLARIDAALKG